MEWTECDESDVEYIRFRTGEATVVDGEQNRLGYFRGYHPDTEYIDPTGYLFDLSAPTIWWCRISWRLFLRKNVPDQALNLLIHNTYTAPGAAKSGSGGSMANNALYSLVENELNKYTRKTGLLLASIRIIPMKIQPVPIIRISSPNNF